MAGYLGTYLAMAYSVVGICSYIVLRMFYGVLQVCFVCCVGLSMVLPGRCYAARCVLCVVFLRVVMRRAIPACC